jgi:hypothetical protein
MNGILHLKNSLIENGIREGVLNLGKHLKENFGNESS